MPRIDLSEREGTASRIGRWATTAALVVATLLAIGAKDARAEVFQGIHELTTLAELREMFPNAKIEELKPAGQKPDEVSYVVSGPGIPGTIGVHFVKSDLPWAPPEECWAALWVRWVPESPLPLKRFVSKYGPPDEAGYDDNMQPYRWWKKIGVSVNLTDDEARVTFVDFTFTNEEFVAGLKIRQARLMKYETPPPAKPKN
ncbi:MAG: hypothetical protein ABFD84_09410 [Candidatus Polarisedimenticolia bacterium]|nr:hypothetical protein [bacterium]